VPAYLLEWDRYVVRRRLGAGGMGEVFEAWDPRLGRFVALKFLAGSDLDTLERFEREARSQAHVDHPAICKVFEVGEVAGHRFIAMQKIEGRTLDVVAGEMTLEQRISILRAIAEAVHAAHRRGLIHRDLKPGNILIEVDDAGSYRPFIVDFGLARDQRSPGATISGTLAGTLGYMSPEQARGRFEEVDRRTDVYNLGIILYELVCGRSPYAFEGMLDSLVRLQSDDVPPPRRFNRDVPADLDTIIMKALDREPARRYQSAHAMAEDLRRFLDGEPIIARPSSIPYRLGKRIRKHRLVASVIAIALLLLAVAGGWALRERWQADARAQLAQRFGMEISEIDLLTRVVCMLPPDRGVRLRRLVLPRMARIREQIAVSGKPAIGPGSYALARGSIVLGDYREAWNLLEAVRAAGYDTPDVHYARGQVLGQFYEDALTRAAGVTEAELRKAAIADAVRRFRAPAVAELRLAANATTASPELLRSQLALREERFDDAIAAARHAFAASPWLYEAVLVEVAALRNRGRMLAESGNTEESLTAFRGARERLANALTIARGDANVYYEQCRLTYQMLGVERFQRRVSPAEAVAAVTPCSVAAGLNPELARAWTTAGAVHSFVAEDQLRFGEDPTAEVELTIAAMRRAGVIDPNEPAAMAGLGRAEMIRARWGIPRGVDPRPRLAIAQQSLEKAVAADPRDAGWRLSLANTYVTRGEYEHRIGNDSRPWLLRAVEQGRRALDIDANLFLVHNQLGNTYNVLADREIAARGDPRPALAEARKAFERARALNPTNAPVHNNSGNSLLTLAEYLAGREEPMEDVAVAAIASYRRAIELRSDYTLPWINIGYTCRLLGQDRLRRGVDPMPALREARAALARYEEGNPGDVDAAVERARAAVIEARWLIASGRDPGRALAEAERVSRGVLAIDKDVAAAKKTLEECAELAARR
jgi:serine/threonine-protein kinase